MEAVLHKNFKKQFKKLSPKIQNQFFERLDIFLEDKFNPVLKNHSVDNAYLGCRSINVTGDYRAIFQEDNEVVTFKKIGTHSELYG